MHRASNPQKLEFWHQHLASIKKYGSSAQAYCREHELSYQSLNYWKKRIGNEICINAATQKKPSFFPVLISEPARISPSKQKNLPDAKWLAEVLFEIQARCS